MSGGFFALLDDIAVLAKLTAATADDIAAGAMKASAKSAGLIVDDAAVTPKYLTGMSPKRELPVIWKISKGSFRNKLLIVLPVILLLSWLAPALLPFILIVGGLYLSFEGAEKVYEWVSRKTHNEDVRERDENKVVASTIRTDLVLSFEIMLISLTAVDSTNWMLRSAILIVVAILMTVVVYGAVALLIRIDDLGVWLLKRKSRMLKTLGIKLIKGMPGVFRGISIIGTLAMLWVGGHILIVSMNDVGFNVFYNVLHKVSVLSEPAGGFVSWVIDAGLSGIFGLIAGLAILPLGVLIEKVAHKLKNRKPEIKQIEESENL